MSVAIQFAKAIVICPGEEWRPDGSGCATCGRPLTGRLRWFCRAVKWFGQTTWWCRDLYMANHAWGDARRVAHLRSSGRCTRCGEPSEEVDHIISRNGMGYGLGCHHHQDKLQPLCNSCHTAIGIARRGGRTVAKAQLRAESMAQQMELSLRWSTGEVGERAP